MSFSRGVMMYMNPYDIHKALINTYILKQPGDTKLLRRNTSNDKNDLDVLREHHKFLWNEETPQTWEEQFAKKYYDKLFKEYSIGDLSLYKENKIALRWRTEQEVVIGKGQFVCGEKKCREKEELRSWEVNFSYQENGEKKNALVKIRLCPSCSKKLNYHTKKRELCKKKFKRLKIKSERSNVKEKICNQLDIPGSSVESTKDKDTINEENKKDEKGESNWDNLRPPEVKTREEEMEDYLHDLLL